MILVIGATGTVGRLVARQLTARGEQVRALVREPDTARQRLGDRIGYVVGDLDRPRSLAPALAAANRVFLLTRQSDRQPDQERAVVDAAVRAGVRHLVKLSVFRADERSPLQIARQHALTERIVRESGLGYAIVRPVFFMQNLPGMIRDGAIRTAAEDGRVAMVDVRDVAAVAVDALTSYGNEGRTYTVTGPQAVTFDTAAATLSRETGDPVRHVHVAPDQVRAALERTGIPAWFARDMARLQSMLADGYEDVVTDDVRTVTGTAPHTLAEFCRDLVSRPRPAYPHAAAGSLRAT
jgi:uncharacterized protein YbjT (DUF2867 family)